MFSAFRNEYIKELGVDPYSMQSVFACPTCNAYYAAGPSDRAPRELTEAEARAEFPWIP